MAPPFNVVSPLTATWKPPSPAFRPLCSITLAEVAVDLALAGIHASRSAGTNGDARPGFAGGFDMCWCRKSAMTRWPPTVASICPAVASAPFMPKVPTGVEEELLACIHIAQGISDVIAVGLAACGSCACGNPNAVAPDGDADRTAAAEVVEC